MHHQIVTRLKVLFPHWSFTAFHSQSPLDDVLLFYTADVVFGPHGASFSYRHFIRKPHNIVAHVEVTPGLFYPPTDGDKRWNPCHFFTAAYQGCATFIYFDEKAGPESSSISIPAFKEARYLFRAVDQYLKSAPPSWLSVDEAPAAVATPTANCTDSCHPMKL